MCKKSLDTLIKEYVNAKEQIKPLDKIVKENNAEIKSRMEQQDLKSYEVGKFKVTMSKSENTFMDEQKTVEILQQKLTPEQFASVVSYKPIINQDVLDNLIYNGTLATIDLEPAMTKGEPKVSLKYFVKKE